MVRTLSLMPRTLNFEEASLNCKTSGIPVMAQQKQIWLASMSMQVWSLVWPSGLRIGVAMSCGVGRRRGSDPTLLWLWCRPAAIALFWPLAWEPPYAAATDLKRKKERKKWKSTFSLLVKLTHGPLLDKSTSHIYAHTILHQFRGYTEFPEPRLPWWQVKDPRLRAQLYRK